ncbi:methylenetetrahydrofolate reductase-domain-containing protein [Naematelia encephala]|uniref:Methylenetetrahydrofolate reductase-domain-containing protein n=1 Tax=Naematelia encephala TaxID=71784 RepID=A0A1Y2B470_9TREE|nr:methylenetetrahydrofolate reductase-domain-containing protein [Naematelia encephala]
MHLTDLIARRNTPFHTYEFFPPRTEAGFVNLLDRIRRLATAPLPPPLAVSITWGAGGSTAERTMELAEQVTRLGLEVILHLTCTNMEKEKVDKALEKARALGIQNVLALRGDPPRSEEYAISPISTPDYFTHADDLVRYIREQHGDYFCIGVAGYPTPHPDSEGPEDDLHWLKIKCDAGADYIITQLFYDVEGFEGWVKTCRKNGIDVPIIPGVMPIQNFASFRRLVNLTQCSVPDSIMTALEPIKSDDAAVKRYGAQLATGMVQRLVSSGLVPGVHFCTLNLEKSVRTILENLGWTPESSNRVQSSPLPRHNQLIEDDTDAPQGLSVPNAANFPIKQMNGLSISPSEASQLAEWGLTNHALPPAPKKGLGNSAAAQAPSAEDSWDEYPNGRFTDVRSPAYGEIDGWGSGLKITAAQALRDWGAPTDAAQLSDLFTRYLESDPSAPTTPFCDLPLSDESATILPYLIKLNSPQLQHWTVGSQPAVDAAHSEDPVLGWGPRGGYVFQKAYVEFFVKREQVERIHERLKDRTDGQISMYAANKQGEFITNTLKDAVNAVTWGVFPGQEIVQSTIIEEESFRAWKEEAFDIWTEWSLLYPRLSPARKLLEGIASEWWLVSLIHHDYKAPDALWTFLLGDEVAA